MFRAAASQRHPAERPARPTTSVPLVVGLRRLYKQHEHFKWGLTQPQTRYHRSALCELTGIGERCTAPRTRGDVSQTRAESLR